MIGVSIVVLRTPSIRQCPIRPWDNTDVPYDSILDNRGNALDKRIARLLVVLRGQHWVTHFIPLGSVGIDMFSSIDSIIEAGRYRTDWDDRSQDIIDGRDFIHSFGFIFLISPEVDDTKRVVNSYRSHCAKYSLPVDKDAFIGFFYDALPSMGSDFRCIDTYSLEMDLTSKPK